MKPHLSVVQLFRTARNLNMLISLVNPEKHFPNIYPWVLILGLLWSSSGEPISELGCKPGAATEVKQRQGWQRGPVSHLGARPWKDSGNRALAAATAAVIQPRQEL